MDSKKSLAQVAKSCLKYPSISLWKEIRILIDKDS